MSPVPDHIEHVVEKCEPNKEGEGESPAAALLGPYVGLNVSHTPAAAFLAAVAPGHGGSFLLIDLR